MDSTRLNNFILSPMNPLNSELSTPLKHIWTEVGILAVSIWTRWGWTQRIQALRLADEIVKGEPRKEMVHRFLEWRTKQTQRTRL